MKIDKKLIKELVGHLNEFNLTELEYQEGQTKIKVSKASKSIEQIKTSAVVSPKKSVEGAVAAVLFSPVIALINGKIFSNDDYSYWLVMGILISITSIVGDLAQSQFKRTAGVKDSGTILLGHGGMYDRIDSLIFTIPFVYLYIYIIQ